MAGNHNSGRRPADPSGVRSPRVRAANPVRPAVLTEVPPPPSGMGRAAAALWREVAALLVEARVLTAADLPALRQYAVVHQRWVDSCALVQELGVVMDGGKRNPAVSAAQACETELLRYAGEFGLTPASRGRVPSAAPTAAAEDDDSFLFAPLKLVPGKK